MKKKIIKILVLSIVFVAALFLSGRYTNRGTTDMTADMGQPTLPTISFKVDDKIVNLTAGHIKEMDLTAVRDAITPVGGQTIDVVIQSYDQKVSSLDYEIYSIDGEKKLFEKSLKEVQEEMSLPVENILEEDQAGFYSRLGFANIDESALIVEYKFSYTSIGGMAKRTFTVPMTEETIIELIKALENKLTANAFTKEQRALMTNKLREFIKSRDNFTCCNCGNSIHSEPNLLLEIDHIIPVSKGGCTVEENLQTLCWKCNRSKSNKI